jgi:hypothetical protein
MAEENLEIEKCTIGNCRGEGLRSFACREEGGGLEKEDGEHCQDYVVYVRIQGGVMDLKGFVWSPESFKN